MSRPFVVEHTERHLSVDFRSPYTALRRALSGPSLLLPLEKSGSEIVTREDVRLVIGKIVVKV